MDGINKFKFGQMTAVSKQNYSKSGAAGNAAGGVQQEDRGIFVQRTSNSVTPGAPTQAHGSGKSAKTGPGTGNVNANWSKYGAMYGGSGIASAANMKQYMGYMATQYGEKSMPEPQKTALQKAGEYAELAKTGMDTLEKGKKLYDEGKSLYSDIKSLFSGGSSEEKITNLETKLEKAKTGKDVDKVGAKAQKLETELNTEKGKIQPKVESAKTEKDKKNMKLHKKILSKKK